MFIFLIRCDSNICISADLVCDGTFIKRSDFFWKLALILMPRFLSWVEPYYFLQFNLCQRTPQSLWNNFSNLFQLPKKYDLLKQFSVIFSKNLLQVQQIPFLSNRTKLAQIFLSLQESAIAVMVRTRVQATIAQVSVIILVYVRLGYVSENCEKCVEDCNWELCSTDYKLRIMLVSEWYKFRFSSEAQWKVWKRNYVAMWILWIRIEKYF